jgi:hypothetical protein
MRLDALNPPRLVDNPLVQPPNRVFVKWASELDVQFLHVRNDRGLPLRLIDRETLFVLDPSNGVRTARPPIEEPHDHLVDLVDLVAQRLEAQLFSHRTYRSTSLSNVRD